MRILAAGALLAACLPSTRAANEMVCDDAPPLPDGADIYDVFPRGGPFTGSTKVLISGTNFEDIGDCKCRFGGTEVAAVCVNSTLIECTTPACTPPSCELAESELDVPVSIEVSLNGVTFTSSGQMFTYVDMRAVEVSALDPKSLLLMRPIDSLGFQAAQALRSSLRVTAPAEWTTH